MDACLKITMSRHGGSGAAAVNRTYIQIGSRKQGMFIGQEPFVFQLLQFPDNLKRLINCADSLPLCA